MPEACFQRARVHSIVGVPGTENRDIEKDLLAHGKDLAAIKRFKKTIGIDQRRVVDDQTTAADLCEKAARVLLKKANISASLFDALICVTQTPDHFQPCNATILHGRLHCNKSCAAFDVNLGCSGYVYGLWLAFMMVEAGGCENVLLLAGDTLSRCVHPKDFSVASLFGDAGSATWVTAAKNVCPSWFVLNSDGQKNDRIIIPAGGFRQEADLANLEEKMDTEGNTRRAVDLYMDGAGVFNFSIQEEPQSINKLLNYAGVLLDGIDAVIFHQANKYIIQNIAQRLKLPLEKTPFSTVRKYGNQSVASIPFTLCDVFGDQLIDSKKTFILSGFGVGLSWGAALLELNQLMCCCISE